MLKKMIIAGLVVIALLGTVLLWKTFKQRSEPPRPETLINKDIVSKSVEEIVESLDNNETNTTQEIVVVVTHSKEDRLKVKERRESSQSASTPENDIDENNNIYTNDESSQKTYVNEPEEERKIEQRIDTSLKESLNDIRYKVQKKINNSSSLSGSSIEVFTNERGIVLSGIVLNAKQKILAGSIANSASENATITNIITVETPKAIEIEKPKDVEPAPVQPTEKSM